MTNDRNEILVEQEVTYILEVNGQLFIVENIPARINIETGEQFFTSDTVERLQDIILNSEKPICKVQTFVYNFAT